MKRTLIVTVVLICLSGLTLVAVACRTLADFVGFLMFGGLLIIAATIYTMGNHPYGYIGLGDIPVLVFFGWLNVMGSWYLQAHTLIPVLILPATACGLLVTAVLNVNNLHDVNSDRENGKNALVVRLDTINARHYHACPLMGTLVCLALLNLSSLQGLWEWLSALTVLLLTEQTRYVMCEMGPVVVRPMLKHTVKAALLTNLPSVVGIFLGQWSLQLTSIN